jgi:hypothetical protein
MPSIRHLSILPRFLLPALLSSLIGKTNGFPLSAGDAVIHAIPPTCTTLPGGSSSCIVGINTVPPLITLDGGYQWLTVEPTTTTESGSTLTTNKAVWTATQTSYLDLISITTTASNGATTVSVSTEYVSFITTTTASAGAAPTVLIAGAVIAPALLGSLQPIVDGAGGKTAEDIGSEILSKFANETFNAAITEGEATQLGEAILVLGGTAAGVYIPFALQPYLANINVAPVGPQKSPSANSPTTATSSATSTVTVTAIEDPPYSNYLNFQVGMTASGPTPTTDDFIPPPTAQCSPSNAGVDVIEAQALVNKFCTGLDLSKSSSTTIQGNATGLQDTYGSSIFFSFNQTANTCSLGCNTSYAQIISSCKFDIFISQLYTTKKD